MRSRLGRRGPDPAVMLGPVVVALLLVGAGLAVARSGSNDVTLSTDGDFGGVVIPSATAAPDRGLEGVIEGATVVPGSTPTPAAPEAAATPRPATTATPAPAAPAADASTATDPPAETGPLAAAGTCFDGVPESVPAIVPVPCEQAHGNEVYVVMGDQSPPGSPYPGRDSLLERTAELCRGDAFTDFVGAPWAESRFFTSPVVPTEDSWGKGDRSVACFLYDLNGTRTGTARGSGAG